MEIIEYVQPREIIRMGAHISLPKGLAENSFIVAIKKHDKVVSFVYFTRFENCVHINYSFTLPDCRRQGFSMLLRKYIIDYAISNHIHQIVSVPFENADSVSLLNTLGFVKNENNDSYVLSICK